MTVAAVLTREDNPELELTATGGVALTVDFRIHKSTTSAGAFEICISVAASMDI